MTSRLAAAGVAASLDMAGHETTHGVTSSTANLTYSGEPGGLNEATSDTFGTLVEFHAANSTDLGDYLIGKKVVKAGFGRTALRYMDQPPKDNSPTCNGPSVAGIGRAKLGAS